ncbi:TonB-dependent receptor [Caulobacter soli]|uniref:TonB-dependent receptor n=1 Tax=Caulobacter soli TaxID=2708539 RepID=UPI0013EB0EBD|nr:TonB-dependent receptor [Caulobacter soli]
MTSISTKALRGVSLLALMASLAPVAAVAQTQAAPAADPSSTSLTEIIVTARRRDESIQDVPAVVNAVTSEALQKVNIRNFTEVQSLVPGLTLTSNSNGTGGNAQIRGVNFDINASGNNPTVEFYLNDAPITAGVVLQQIYDVGQIEVLRGPQGTLRGRASPSGSITITTKKPDLYREGGYVSSTVNDIGTANVNGAVNIPVVEGVAAIRIGGLYNDDDGNLTRSTDTTQEKRKAYSRTESGRISGLVTPIDWLRLEGSYQSIVNNFRNFDPVESFSVVNPSAPASPTLIKADDRMGFQAWPRTVKQRYNIYNWRSEVSALGQQLIYQGQHYTQDIYSDESQDPANVFPTTDLIQHTVSHIKSTSQEVRLQNQERVFDIFDYVVGYFDNKNNTPTTLNRPTAVRLPAVMGGGVAQVVQTAIGRAGHSREKSIYGNVTAHIGDATQISGGLRHIDYNDVGQLLVGGALISQDVHADKKWVYTASIQHSFTRDLMVYVNTGSSYRPGITAVGDFNLAPSALERSFINLPAETSKSYEAGVKSTLFDHRMRLNVSGFHQKFANYPYRAPNGVYYVNTTSDGAGGTVQQVAQFNFVAAVPVEVNGVEGEVSYDLTPNWNIGAVTSYALGKIKNGVIPCNDLNGDGKPDVTTVAPSLAALQAATGGNNLSKCKASQRSSFQPPFSTTIQSEYSQPIGNFEGYVRGLVYYNGKSQGDPTNTFDDVKGYALANLYAGLRAPDRAWEVTLYAKNLFDTTKVLSRTNPLSTSYQQLPGAIIGGVPTITGRPAAVTDTSTYTGITTTPPREFGVTLRVALGSR